MIIVPKDRLSEEILRQVVLEFVSREGTDYGHMDWDMDDKVEQVLDQIERGEVVIAYNDKTESCNLLKKDDAIRELKAIERREHERQDYP